MESALGVRQLRLVDHQAGVGAVVLHRVQNLVEGHLHGSKSGCIRRSVRYAVVSLPGNRDALALQILRRDIGCAATTMGP